MNSQNHAQELRPFYQELRPYGLDAFPCTACLGRLGKHPDLIDALHWHEELELVYVKNGTLELQLPGNLLKIQQGNCVAINSNTFHELSGAPDCELQSIVFHPSLITGGDDTIFAIKYLDPLIHEYNFQYFIFDTNTTPSQISNFNKAFTALTNQTEGYAFIVRDNLSEICCFLYQQFSCDKSSNTPHRKLDYGQTLKMLEYIHKNFAQQINLSDIAKAANIGQNTCLRYFHRNLQTSPMQYLLKYRIRQGSIMLIEQQQEWVSEIASLCGFHSSSYFSKWFRIFYGCTPTEYRINKLRRTMCCKNDFDA